VGEQTCRHGQQRARSAKQAKQEHKNSTRTRISPQEGCARALQTEDRTHHATSTSPSLAAARQPTLRINDDNDYDDVDHNDNGAATSDDSAHYKQADTTHN